jgi:hypothetical protein
MFEFGTFAQKDFEKPVDFLERLSLFLGSLPTGWDYAVEIRNKEYLGADYFEVLRSHGVAHVFNAWTRMPTLDEQMALPGAVTADHIVVRALLAHGRSYEQAVKMFEPYERVQAPNPAARTAMATIAGTAVKQKKRAYIYVNNRLEGNSPATIAATLVLLAGN